MPLIFARSLNFNQVICSLLLFFVCSNSILITRSLIFDFSPSDLVIFNASIIALGRIGDRF